MKRGLNLSIRATVLVLSGTTEKDNYRQLLAFRIIGPRPPSFDARTSALQLLELTSISRPEPSVSLLIVTIHPHVDKTASVLIHRAFPRKKNVSLPTQHSHIMRGTMMYTPLVGNLRPHSEIRNVHSYRIM
jgi:hypothetical protein